MKQSYTNYMKSQEDFSDMCVTFSEYVIEFQNQHNLNDIDMIEVLKAELQNYEEK